MSGSRNGPEEFAREVGQEARRMASIVRRMVVTRADSAQWQILGHTLLEGDPETWEADVFGGIGIAARPAGGDDVEALVAFPGGPGNPVIVATRQEGVRRVIAADLEADETQLHNSRTLIRIMRDGTVEIRSAGGVAKELAYKSDVEELRAKFHGHTHVVSTTGSAAAQAGTAFAIIPAMHAAPVQGTAVLKGE